MHGAAPPAPPARCPPRHFFELPWALRVEIIGEAVFVGGIVLAAIAMAALAAYLYHRRRRGRREKLARGAAEAATAATIAALEARAEAAEKELRDLRRARAVEEGSVSRRADKVVRSLAAWRRALDGQAGHLSSTLSHGSEVEVPLPPPPVARRHRRSRSSV